MKGTLVDKSVTRCQSWATHSGLSAAKMAERAGVSPFSIWRLKRKETLSVETLRKIEASIPTGWRHPYAGNGEAA